jgi:DNA repair exonuclease SbcCD ATPase subunit
MSNANIQIQTWTRFIADLEHEIEGLNGSSKLIEDNNVEIKELRDELKASIALKEQLVGDRQILDVAGVLLKDTGIKTKIIKQYVPIINKLINKYLASMDFFVKFELNENFEESIKSRFRDEFSYDSFSEGEKMRIDLALLFTWRTIAKLRNSASTNLLIMDEVFDSSLDNTGTDEFLKIMNTLVQDTNVFIISHKGDQLFDKFEHTIRFEKHKNFSRMVG